MAILRVVGPTRFHDRVADVAAIDPQLELSEPANGDQGPRQGLADCEFLAKDRQRRARAARDPLGAPVGGGQEPDREFRGCAPG